MRQLFNFMLLGLFVMFAISCSKNSDDCINGNCEESAQWEWIRTYGTIAGTTWTPQSTNTTKSLFMNENTLMLFVDGEEINRYEYEVFLTDTIDSDNEIRSFIAYNGKVRRYNETETELSLIDLCCDGLDDYYLKR